jgi:hypothetical protein
MIALRTDMVASLGSPAVTGDGETAVGTNDFLLQLLAQLHGAEATAVDSASLSVAPALPDTSMGTVTSEQADNEHHVLEQLLQRLQDLVAEVLGTIPQVSDVHPPVHREEGEVFAPQHGSDAALQLTTASPEHDSSFELLATAPTSRSFQKNDAVFTPVSTPTGVVVELDEYVASSDLVSVPDEVTPTQPVLSGVAVQHSTEQAGAALPAVAQTAAVEMPDGETRLNEFGVSGESDQQPTSQTGDTMITQQPVHEGSPLGNAPGTPFVAEAMASAVSAVFEESATAEPRVVTDDMDDTPIPQIRTLTPLRSLSVPRNTVVLQVEPPELGTLVMQVRQVDEHFTASFWAESSEVRSLLQGHFPALNEALSQQGFEVSQLTLNMHLGHGFAGHSGSFARQHAPAMTFSHGQPGEEHEPLDAGGRRFAGAISPGYGSGHVDITI